MAETIAQLLRESVQRDPGHGVQLVKDASGEFQRVSWKELYEHSKAFGAGLLSLGGRRGNHVGIISDNMKEWLWADLAIISIGAADVPRGSDSMAQEIRFILDHAYQKQAAKKGGVALYTYGEVEELGRGYLDSPVSPKRGFKLFERVNRIAFLARPFKKGKEITHTLKLRRNVITELYEKDIKELFKERR